MIMYLAIYYNRKLLIESSPETELEMLIYLCFCWLGIVPIHVIYPTILISGRNPWNPYVCANSTANHARQITENSIKIYNVLFVRRYIF